MNKTKLADKQRFIIANLEQMRTVDVMILHDLTGDELERRGYK